MSYKPNQFGEYERSWSYDMMWIGLPASILYVATQHVEALSFLAALAGGATAGTLIGLALQWSADEYVRGQIAFAANFALSFAGIVLFTQMVSIFDGFAPSSGDVLAWLAIVFHAALAFRRLSDNGWSVT